MRCPTPTMPRNAALASKRRRVDADRLALDQAGVGQPLHGVVRRGRRCCDEGRSGRLPT